jgi:hypothetical protein
MRTQVLGLQEGAVTAALAAGSVLASVGVETIGVGATLLATGGSVLAAGVLAGPGVRRVDAASVVPTEESALLRGVPMFAVLPLATLEELATGSTWLEVEAGATIIRAGEPGDRFYVIASGSVGTTTAGEAEHRHGAGEGFGEIALLRDVPRTATVRALEPTRLAVIERGRFLAAVTGDRTSLEAADRLILRHLAGDATPS